MADFETQGGKRARSRTEKGCIGCLGSFALLLLVVIVWPSSDEPTIDDNAADAQTPTVEGLVAPVVNVSPTAAEGDTAAARLESEIAMYRERANSDDAQTIEEAFFHAEARALVIRHVEPNKLGVGGREFRVKKHPGEEGAFVYDPRTRFSGVERFLVWWVVSTDRAYPLNGPSKGVTPSLPWPRDDNVVAPSTGAVLDYVFHGVPMTGGGAGR